MNDDIFKKLIINALQVLLDNLGDNSCNDLFEDDPLLNGISKAAFKSVVEDWKEKYPEKAEDFDGEIQMDVTLLEYLIEELYKKKIS